MKFDIIIIGAGASGLAAAYHAISKKPQLNILVLEKERIAGRKLNASGNGKCNLTNAEFHTECYHSYNPNFIEEWTRMHSYQEVITFFENMGILLYEKNGYYYPISNQAKQVSMLLYEKSKKLGVTYAFQSKVTSIEPVAKHGKALYQIMVQQENQKKQQYEAEHVIIATGGYASARLGGCKDGYKLAKELKMKCNPIYPVLSPVYVEDRNLSLAKGVRLDGVVTLKLADGTIVKEAGQIQFNNDNLSGIVMMNLSCYLNKKQDEVNLSELHIDVLMQYSWEQLKDFFVTQKGKFPEESLEDMLSGILPNAFLAYVLKRLNLNRQMVLSSMTEKQLNRLVSALKKLEFTPVYVEDFDKAQVTGGGISIEEILPESFESRKYKNLYITGEVLDVNGKCGGYNLTFAILSGIKAVDTISNVLHSTL